MLDRLLKSFGIEGFRPRLFTRQLQSRDKHGRVGKRQSRDDRCLPAASGNICLGVWKKTGVSHYKLNHFYLQSDPATDTLQYRIQIREEIDLDRSGDKHSGTFTIDGYDLAGNPVFHVEGTVQATRITVKTDLKDLF